MNGLVYSRFIYCPLLDGRGGCLALRLICLLGREHSWSSVIAQLLFPVLVVREMRKSGDRFQPCDKPQYTDFPAANP